MLNDKKGPAVFNTDTHNSQVIAKGQDMFGKVKLTALELAELFGKAIPQSQELREPAPQYGTEQGGRPSSFPRVKLTSEEVRLLTRPLPELLETTMY